MMHSLFLLAGSFLLAGGTAGFGIISTVFAALATWASYRSAQAKNRGDIEAAASSAKDARRWRKVTWVALVVIGVLAVAVYALLLLFVVAAEMSYAY